MKNKETHEGCKDYELDIYLNLKLMISLCWWIAGNTLAMWPTFSGTTHTTVLHHPSNLATRKARFGSRDTHVIMHIMFH